MIAKDFYEEKGIKAKSDVKRTVSMWLVGGVSLISLIGTYWILPCFVIFIITLILFIMMFRERYIEYDYCFANDEIEIAKIMNRKRRRTAITFDMNNIRLIAPEDSIRLSNEREKKSSNSVYGLYFRGTDG